MLRPVRVFLAKQNNCFVCLPLLPRPVRRDGLTSRQPLFGHGPDHVQVSIEPALDFDEEIEQLREGVGRLKQVGWRRAWAGQCIVIASLVVVRACVSACSWARPTIVCDLFPPLSATGLQCNSGGESPHATSHGGIGEAGE